MGGWGIPFGFDRRNKSSQLLSGPSKRGQVTLIICKFKVFPAHPNQPDLDANRPMASDRDLNVPWMLVKHFGTCRELVFHVPAGILTLTRYCGCSYCICCQRYSVGPNIVIQIHLQSCFKTRAFKISAMALTQHLIPLRVLHIVVSWSARAREDEDEE